MILTLILVSIVTVSANPFHKYPYVFLLDVGNEELEKVNSEQIRLSGPGGSVAVRYPAVGNGDDIAHVRVSGIDFGADLKANIVDGGPGYKYVVLVLMGNRGVAYDAVLTIQTVPAAVDDENIQSIEDESNQNLSVNQVSEEDQNHSAEELNDSQESDQTSQVVNDKNEELAQGSSNSYKYVPNEALSGYGNEQIASDDDVSIEENESDKVDYEEDPDQNNSQDEESDDGFSEEDSRNQNGEDYVSDDVFTSNAAQSPAVERYTSEDDYGQGNTDIREIVEKYQKLQSQTYSDDTNPQETEEYAGFDRTYQSDENRPVVGEYYEDYEESDSGKYADTNNNFIDTGSVSAVDY